MRFAFALIVLALMNPFTIAQDQDSSINGESEQFFASKSKFDSYVKNRDKVEKYCCAMFVERTNADLRDRARSTFVEEWYLCCAHPSKKLLRNDRISYIESDGSDSALSILFDRDDIHKFNGRDSMHVTAESDKSLRESLGRFCFFDPWILPLRGQTEIRPKPVQKPKSDVINYLSGLKPVAQVTDDAKKLTVFEYPMSAKEPIFDQIGFSSTVGDMPVVLERVVRDNGVMERSRTTWVKEAGIWFPESTNCDSWLGDLKKPATHTNTFVRFKWIWNDAVDEGVFASDKRRPNTHELRDYVMRLAAERKEKR